MSNVYGNMMDSAFGPYYERFRALKATSEETAVPRNQIFPEGESLRDKDAMHKMLSTGVVKRVGMNNYFLDEELIANPNKVLMQRLFIILGAVAFAGVLLLLRHFGIINF